MRQSYSVLKERLPLYLSGDTEEKLLRYLSVVPAVSDNRLKSAACLASSICNQEINNNEIQVVTWKEKPNAGKDIHAQYIYSIQENEMAHTPFEFEEMICDDVLKGDTDALLRHLSGSIPGNLGKLSEDEERQARYMFVTSTAVVSRTAIKGGVHSETAYSLADSYCQKMDSLQSIEQISALMWEMLAGFCEAVKEESSSRNYSLIIKSCCNYISKHLHTRILLSDLAIECGMSERRLSEKFLKETGVHINDFVHSQKLHEARQLLLYSSMDISNIASSLAYSSQSYFTRKYREEYGVTPFEVRSKS